MLIFVVTKNGLQQGFNEAVTHFALFPVENMWSHLEYLFLFFSLGHLADLKDLISFNQENEAHLLNLLINQILTNIHDSQSFSLG